MNHFSGKFLSNCSFVLLWVGSSERLHNKATLLKTRKASKVQEEILTCALYVLCRSPRNVFSRRSLETLSCNFIKTGLHRWHFPRKVPTFFWLNNFTKTPPNNWLERVFIYLVSKIIIASAGRLSKCNRKSTVIAL